MEQLKPLYIAGANAKYYTHYEKSWVLVLYIFWGKKCMYMCVFVFFFPTAVVNKREALLRPWGSGKWWHYRGRRSPRRDFIWLSSQGVGGWCPRTFCSSWQNEVAGKRSTSSRLSSCSCNFWVSWQRGGLLMPLPRQSTTCWWSLWRWVRGRDSSWAWPQHRILQ